MSASLHVYPIEGGFDVTRFIQRLQLKHLWFYMRQQPQEQRWCGTFFSHRVERTVSDTEYNIQDPLRPEHRLPYFEFDSKYVLVCLNWSDTHSNDARRFLNFVLHEYACKAQDHDGFWYESNKEIRKSWMQMWFSKR
jgi:hypothetical protein